MASLTRDKNGSKRIQLMFAKADRRTIYLGKINVKVAEQFLSRIERLIASVQTGTPIDSQTAQWLSSLPDETYSKCVHVGLVESRESTTTHTLESMLDEYFATMSVKQSTRTRYEQTRRLLLEHFNKARALDSITTRDADKWRSFLEAKQYASAKIARDVSVARMFFKQAVRWDMVSSNPFEGVRAGAQTNRAPIVLPRTPRRAQTHRRSPWRRLALHNRTRTLWWIALPVRSFGGAMGGYRLGYE